MTAWIHFHARLNFMSIILRIDDEIIQKTQKVQERENLKFKKYLEAFHENFKLNALSKLNLFFNLITF